MKRIASSFLICWVLLFPFGAAAGPFSDIFVLGDSLSDQGNISLLTGGLVPPSEYTDGITSGRFTNGANYVDHLAASLGLSVTPSILGGNNFAYGGARTHSQSLGGIPVPGALSVLAQRDALLAQFGGGPVDSGALFIVWAGANNLVDIVETAAGNPFYDPTPDFAQAIGDIGNIVASLAAGGAKTVLVPNLPDFGRLPLITGGGGPVLGATILTQIFNSSLDTVLNDVAALFGSLDLVRFDTFSLFDDVVMNPSAFGFTNVTGSCYDRFGLPGGTTCVNPDEYVSWDGFHPTVASHRLVAARMSLVLAVPEPDSFVLIVIGLLGLGAASFRRVKIPFLYTARLTDWS